MTNNMNWLANLTKAVGDVRPHAQQARTWHSQLAQTYGLLATVIEYGSTKYMRITETYIYGVTL